jgi:hypothetical protein
MGSSPETSVLTSAVRSHIPENGIIHSHCGENLKSDILGIFYLVSFQDNFFWLCSRLNKELTSLAQNSWRDFYMVKATTLNFRIYFMYIYYAVPLILLLSQASTFAEIEGIRKQDI